MQACLSFSSLPSRDDCLAAFLAPDMHLAAYAIGIAALAIVAKLAADFFLN